MERELNILPEKRIDRFMNSAEFKGVIQIIPWLGPYISEKISSRENKFIQARIEFFIQDLYSEINAMKDVTLVNWLESEENYDIFNIAIESSVQNRSREKSLMNAKLLMSALRGDVEDLGLVEEFLYSLKDLSPIEIKALAVIYHAFNTYEKSEHENELQFSVKIKWRELLIEKCLIQEDDIDFIVKRLENTGLISEITGGFLNYSGGQIKINKTFKKLIKNLHTSE
ncbi:hypothetical protein [Solibacillus sp. CAU 1738]|uniref:hypothetical protein n=1 Tax=Solibacillus sp. CAU 1738 TaxID=3140363 RepID=UPI0032609730